MSKPVEAVINEWRAAGVPQFVYFIQQGDDGPVKIGTAADPLERLRQLQPGNPVPLTIRYVVPGDHPVERALHRHFADFRLTGEWFDMAPAVLAWAAEMETRALAHLEARGVAPVTYIRCLDPIDAQRRAELWERLRSFRLSGIPSNRISQEMTQYGNDLTFHGVDWDAEWDLCRKAAA